MALSEYTINISVKVHISLWDALKLRIADSKIQQVIEKTEDKVGNVRINETTGKVEICSAIYLSKERSHNIWVDYDENLLMDTLGVCPQCHSFYPLFNFRRIALMEEQKNNKNE